MTAKTEHFDRIAAQQAARRRGPPEEAELAGFIAQVPSPPRPPGAPEKARPFRQARAPLRRLAIKGFALSGDML